MVRLNMSNVSRLGSRGLATSNNPQRSLSGSDSIGRYVPRFTPRAAFSQQMQRMNQRGSMRGTDPYVFSAGGGAGGIEGGGPDAPVLPPPPGAGISPVPSSNNQPTRASGGYGTGRQTQQGRNSVVYRPTFAY